MLDEANLVPYVGAFGMPEQTSAFIDVIVFWVVKMVLVVGIGASVGGLVMALLGFALERAFGKNEGDISQPLLWVGGLSGIGLGVYWMYF